MKFIDSNKPRRDAERRELHRAGWIAVPALKRNGSHTWRWIIAGRKKAYERQEALKIARRK